MTSTIDNTFTNDSSVHQIESIDDIDARAREDGVVRVHTSGENNELIHLGDKVFHRDELVRAFVGTFTVGLTTRPVRKFGNPIPMGLASFAFCLFIVSLTNVHARGVTTPNVVAGAALLYGAVTQILTGMWAMALENTFAATVFGSYGAFWASYAALLIPGFGIAEAYKPEEFGTAVSFFLFGWLIFTTMNLILVIRSTLGFFVLFVVLEAVFCLLAVGNYTGSIPVIKAAGWLGLILTFIALYEMYIGLAEPGNSYYVPKTYFMPGAA